MNKNTGAAHAGEQHKRLSLNINKIEAALCIALSAVVSLAIIGWLLL